MSDTRHAYRRQLETFERVAGDLRSQSSRLSWARLAIAASGVVLLWPIVFAEVLHVGWLGLPVLAFMALVTVHERIEGRRRRADKAIEYLRQGLARLDGDWVGQGCDGARFVDPAHPYASDLDLFGRGSLFEFVCAARTADGQATLAGWFKVPSEASVIWSRQAAVDELRGRDELRLDLALIGDDLGDGVDTAALVAWAEAPAILTARWPAVVAGVLAVVNLVTLVAWAAPISQRVLEAAQGSGQLDMFEGILPFALASLVSVIFAKWHGAKTGRVLHGADRPQQDLALLAAMLGRLEDERFEAPELSGLADALAAGGQPPSRAIARLTRLVEIEESRHNMIFAMFGGLVHTGTQLAHAMENWRKRHGGSVRAWVDAVARFEALSSLARHGYENPEDTFPEFVEGAPRFSAVGMTHPLLAASKAVRNDVALGGESARLWVVSGSNMAGKSTMLRTVGANVVLALAGAPVRARSMQLTTLQLGASMRIVDSLQEGASHLYAEIRRFRSIVDLCSGPIPLLFLLDEVLHGTNSSDRRAGAAAVVRTLVDAGALGMITTHDLALAKIADDLGDAGANVHFIDHMQDGELAFDYTLREGPVQRGNALELMRAIGLDV